MTLRSSGVRRVVFFLVVCAAAACSAYHSGTDDAGASATDGGLDAMDDVGSTPPPTPPPGASDAGYGCPAPGDAGSGCDGGTVWNGHCYFFAGGTLASQAAADGFCRAEGAHLATFTCAAEWQSAKPTLDTNAWFGAEYGSTGWTWSTGEAFTFVNVGEAFDGGPPDAGVQCLWADKSGQWRPVPCGATSANAYCERP